jgi:RND family efflux transporter MFP subunit
VSIVWAALGIASSPARSIELDCLIQPEAEVTLSSAVEGLVDAVLVDRGDVIEEGELVATLVSDVEKANLEVARARAEMKAQLERGAIRVEFAERNLARNARLQEQEILSDREMDEAESEKRLAEAELLEAREATRVARLDVARAKAVLGLRRIHSPVNGVVVDRILSPGEYADPPQVLEIAQIDPLRVEVFAPLAVVGKISVGTRAEVMPEAPIGGVYEATVTVVDRVIDAASGTLGVRLALPNPDFALPAGLKCRVLFDVPESDVAEPPAPAP